MSFVGSNILAGASGQGGAAGYAIERSLRFNPGDTAFLNRNFSTGNRKTYTLSFWIKLAQTGTENTIFGHMVAGYQTQSMIRVEGTGRLDFGQFTGSWNFQKITTRLLRDLSAWYHIVYAVDTTLSTAEDRIKVYINGERETSFSTNTNPSQNLDTLVNSNVEHGIGRATPVQQAVGGNYYLADMHFIDGQTLAATDFGETDDNGVWQPKKFAGSYNDAGSNTNLISETTASNGFNSSYPVENMFDGSTNTVTQNHASTSNNYITWTPTTPIQNVTSLRVYATLNSNQYDAREVSVNGGTYYNPNVYGSTQWWDLIANTQFNSGDTLTEIKFQTRWFGGGAPSCAVRAIEVNGVILQAVSAGVNGFHLSFSDNSSNAALGTDTSGNSNTWTVNNLTANAIDYAATGSDPNSKINAGSYQNFWDGNTSTYVQIAQGAYVTMTDNGSNAIGTASTNVGFYTANGASTATLRINGSNVFEANSNSLQWYDFSFTGPIYKVEIGYLGGSGSSNNFYDFRIDGTVLIGSPSSNTDSLVDTPTNGDTANDTGAGGEITGNHATLNPLEKHSHITLSNGNLEATTSSNWKSVLSTIGMTSGKWYWELTVDNIAQIGVCGNNTDRLGSYLESDPTAWVLQTNAGAVYTGASGHVSTGVAWAAGDIVNIAYDRDTTSIWFGKNGTWVLSGNPAGGTNAVATNAGPGSTGRTMMVGLSVKTSSGGSINFGQRAFAYAAPSGYKSLNTANLPTPTIADGSLYFDTKLYTGTGSAQSIGGFGFSPDLVWYKSRSNSLWHGIYDIVRGVNKGLFPNATQAETTYAAVTAFNSDGFNIGTVGDVNTNSATYVSWAWDAGDSNTTIAVGSLNSSVYNQSQNWTNLISFNAGAWNGNGTNPFDADATNSDYGNTNRANGGYATLNISSLTGSRVISVTSEQTEVTITHDGGTTTFTPSTTSRLTHTFDAVTNPTSIKFDGLNWNSQFVLVGVSVDGQRLVNSGLTLPNVPSIASTVRANPSAGFSIVTYTGGSSSPANSDSGDSFGHGLGAAPKLVICKKRTGGNSWPVYHASTALGALTLDSTNALDTASYLFAQKHPTSSVVYLGNNPEINNSSHNYVAYCFAPVEGYSAFGSYTGNGSTDGPFVYTGFRPKFLLIKGDNSSSWLMLDSSREPNNVVGNYLQANSSLEENGSSAFSWLDFTSNGFKNRNNGSWHNTSNVTYIYMAFAEHPFKTARAR